MAQKTIPDLPLVGSLSAAALFEISQAGVSYRATPGQIGAFVSAATGITVDSSIVANGTNGYILYNNNGVLGNSPLTTLMASISPTLSGSWYWTGIVGIGGVPVTGLPLSITTTNTATSGLGERIIYGDNGALSGPRLELYRISASPAVADLIGRVSAVGLDSNLAPVNYALMTAKIVSPTAGVTTGSWIFGDDIIDWANISATGLVTNVNISIPTNKVYQFGGLTWSSVSGNYVVASGLGANAAFVFIGNSIDPSVYATATNFVARSQDGLTTFATISVTGIVGTGSMSIPTNKTYQFGGSTWSSVSGNYVVAKGLGAGAASVFIGNSSDPACYFTATTTVARSEDGLTTFFTANATGLAVLGAVSGTSITTSATNFLHITTGTLANGAAAQTATMTNGPTAGNPTKWIPINDNGTTRYFPAW